ncbi:Phosphatidylethanolamine-binding family protein [Brugia pahangi]
MHYLLLMIVVMLYPISTEQGSDTTMSVEEAFKKYQVVPDVISMVPTKLINVDYSGGAKVNLGNELTPTQVKDEPKVSWDAEAKSLYTLVMTDPDAPSRQNPKFREWHHWLVVNIPGQDVSKGDVFSEYIGSGPPKGTGLHRYVFLVYKQPEKIVDVQHGHLTNKSGKNRANFKIAKFAEKHKLGNPIAGNFYQAQYDNYVAKLYEQLSD